jgi:integrase
MSLYKRGTVWHYDFAVDGLRFRGSTKEPTLSRARTVESLLIAEAKEKGRTILNRRSPLLSEFAVRFFGWVDSSALEARSKRYYRDGWRILSNTRLRGMRLSQIYRDEVESLRFPGSASNSNRAIRTLRRMLGKAEEWKLIASAPKLKLVKEYGRSAVLDAESERKLLATASHHLRDVLIVMLDTGMRPQEVFCMRWEDVDWEKLTIFVPKGKTRNARRHVPISQRLLGVLKQRCNADSSGWVFASKSKTGHLTTVKTAFQRARKLAGLDSSVVLYTARHTFATNTLAATGNLALLMRAMGHSNAQTAMIYQHPSLDLVREAVDSRNLALERHNHVTAQSQAIQ